MEPQNTIASPQKILISFGIPEKTQNVEKTKFSQYLIFDKSVKCGKTNLLTFATHIKIDCSNQNNVHLNNFVDEIIAHTIELINPSKEFIDNLPTLCRCNKLLINNEENNELLEQIKQKKQNKNIVKPVVLIHANNINEIKEDIKEGINEIKEDIKESIVELKEDINEIKEDIVEIIDVIDNNVVKLKDVIDNNVVELKEDIKESISEIKEDIVEIIDVIVDIKDEIKEEIEQVIEKVNDLENVDVVSTKCGCFPSLKSLFRSKPKSKPDQN